MPDRSPLTLGIGETPFQLPRRIPRRPHRPIGERAHIAAVLQEVAQSCVMGHGRRWQIDLAATVARDIAAAFPDGVLWPIYAPPRPTPCSKDGGGRSASTLDMAPMSRAAPRGD